MKVRTTLKLALLCAASAALACAAEAKLPSYSREVLPNGTVLLMMPRTGVPLVHIRILVRGGAEAETADRAGLSNVAATLLRRGTTKRSADQFSEELDSLGGTFNTMSEGASSTAISAEFLAKDFDKGLDLVSDALLHATFPDDEVKKELARRVDASKAIKDNPGGAIGQYAMRAFFGRKHPYGNPPDELSYARITRDDLVAYSRNNLVGRNLVVALTGDFDPAAAKAKIARTIGEAPAGAAFTWAQNPAPSRAGKLWLIDKPDATQTYFIVAQPGIDRKSPDRIPLEIVNTLFGGRFTSMLNDALRVNSGLTYGARSVVNEERTAGAIMISTYTKVDSTVKAVDMALDVLKTLTEKGINAEQLASAKSYLKGTYPTGHLETIDQLARTLTTIELYGLGREEVDKYYARVDAVTLAQANAVAKKYYRADDLTFVLLGPAAKIRDGVKKYSPSLIELSVKSPGWGE